MGVRWIRVSGGLLLATTILTVPALAHDRRAPIISVSTNGRGSSRSGLLTLMQTLHGMRDQLRGLENQLEIENHRIARLRAQQQTFFAEFYHELAHKGQGAATGPVTLTPPGAAGGASRKRRQRPNPSVTVIPPNANAAPVTHAHKGDAALAYRHAFNLLRTGRYRHAVSAFQGFLAHYPTNKRADKAQYWVAETDYVERQYPQALSAFRRLVHQYPHSKKVPNALLKMGYIAKWQGHAGRARTTWQSLIAHYPNSMAAQVARNSLASLAPAK